MVDQDMGTAPIDPGKPWQNGVNECFNGELADECLGLAWFRSRAQAEAASAPRPAAPPSGTGHRKPEAEVPAAGEP